MNTVKKGNDFEERSYNIIQNTIETGQLGILQSQCRIFRKKGYFSKDREKDIIFDLAIEVWPSGAERYVLLYIIECKSYSSHKVPVNDVEEFYAKINQVAGVNVKGIFITDSELQEGAFKFARSKGMMIINVKYDDDFKIILHKIHRAEIISSGSKTLESCDDAIERFLINIFNIHTKVLGLNKLTAENIEEKTKELLNDFDPEILKNFMAIPYKELLTYLNTKHNLKIIFEPFLGYDHYHNRILGYFKKEENIIYIDQNIVNTDRFLFILCHEIGHYFLHRNLQMNQTSYNSFKDSEFNYKINKHILGNDKNWIEWQANQFSASLIVPKKSLYKKLLEFQFKHGIRNKGTVYLDNQKVNNIDFFNMISTLARFFKVTKTNIIYRLEQNNILKYGFETPKHWSSFWEDYNP